MYCTDKQALVPIRIQQMMPIRTHNTAINEIELFFRFSFFSKEFRVQFNK
jgi:hypothetical protein